MNESIKTRPISDGIAETMDRTRLFDDWFALVYWVEMIKRIYRTMLIVLTIIVATWFILAGDDPNHPYKLIELGMKASEVDAILDANPEFIFSYDGYRIFYYRSPSRLGDHIYGDIEGYVHGMKVDALTDLPDYYGYYQLAFDTNDQLVAFTWIGEAYTVKSVDGSVKGSHLSKLVRLPKAN